jgi:hypothetical protein
MGGTGRPTEKQLAKLAELEAKPKRTAKQDEELAALRAKRDAKPELSKGAKTYCENWLKSKIYGKRQDFSSKYTEKGILCEPAAIDLVAEYMGYGMVSKHEGRVSNEYMEGECDLLLPVIVEDIKNSWSVYTFPLFDAEPDPSHIDQMQGYMELYNRPKAAVNYCLINAPESIIDSEAFIASRKAGFDELDIELYDEVRARLTYDDIPVHLRIKRFEFARDTDFIKQVEQQVILCREYIDLLTTAVIEAGKMLIA